MGEYIFETLGEGRRPMNTKRIELIDQGSKVLVKLIEFESGFPISMRSLTLEKNGGRNRVQIGGIGLPQNPIPTKAFYQENTTIKKYKNTVLEGAPA
jgi:hypothetical protein